MQSDLPNTRTYGTLSDNGLEPAQLLQLLHDDLTPFVQDNAGLLSIASDPWNFLELLSEKPNGWRCILHWDGDVNIMSDPRAGCFCDNNFSIGVTAQKGLSAKPQEQLYRPRAGGAPSLLALVAMVRARVRGFLFPRHASQQSTLYLGCESIALPDGTPLDGYRLRFSVKATPEPVQYRT
jgi:hypothetical protein